jgi:hypothetical protein
VGVKDKGKDKGKGNGNSKGNGKCKGKGKGKVKVVTMGMAGVRIAGKGTVKVTDGGRMFCTQLPPGDRLGRIINRLQSNRLSRTA